MSSTPNASTVEKLFWQDAYLARVDTRIVQVDGDRVRLAATNFFAFSGGQESDSGTIGGHAVTKAEKDGLDIVYTLAPDHALRAGDDVEVAIDWARRYALMRHHFAAEMVLQLVYRLRPGIVRVGAHIAPAKARIDFESERNIGELFEATQAETAALISAAKPIVTAFSDEATQRRYWEVDGFARMACGGTHPRTTAEIGALTLKRKNQGKGTERIDITLGAAPASG